MAEDKKETKDTGEPKVQEKPAEVTQPKVEAKQEEATQSPQPSATPAKPEAKPEAKKEEAKKEVARKKEKPANCAACNKSIRKKRWYYRNGKYYCTKRCWKTTIKKEEKPKEAEEKK